MDDRERRDSDSKQSADNELGAPGAMTDQSRSFTLSEYESPYGELEAKQESGNQLDNRRQGYYMGFEEDDWTAEHDPVPDMDPKMDHFGWDMDSQPVIAVSTDQDQKTVRTPWDVTDNIVSEELGRDYGGEGVASAETDIENTRSNHDTDPRSSMNDRLLDSPWAGTDNGFSEEPKTTKGGDSIDLGQTNLEHTIGNHDTWFLSASNFQSDRSSRLRRNNDPQATPDTERGGAGVASRRTRSENTGTRRFRRWVIGFGVACLVCLFLVWSYTSGRQVQPEPVATERSPEIEAAKVRQTQKENGQVAQKVEEPPIDPEPVVLEKVEDQIYPLTQRLLSGVDTEALVYPKNLDVQKVELRLKSEQEKRKAERKRGPSKDEQIELIRRMLSKQMFVITRQQIDAELKSSNDLRDYLDGTAASRLEKEKIIRDRLIDVLAMGIEELRSIPGGHEQTNGPAMRFPGESSYKEDHDRSRRWTSAKDAAEKYRNNLESEAGRVSETEIRSEYDKNKIFFEEPEKATVAHIFVRVPTAVSEAERNDRESLIRRIHVRAIAGEDFLTLASRYSDDGTGRGGLMNAVEKDELEQTLGAEVFRLKPNEISPVIRSGKGYHVFKLINSTRYSSRSFEEVRTDIQSRLRGEKVVSAMSARLQELKTRLVILKK